MPIKQYRNDPWPSDVSWIRGWGKRLTAWVDDDEPPNRYVWMIFRPDRHARDAMMRLSIQYPHIIKQLEDMVDWADKWLDRLDEGEAAMENLAHAMFDLRERVNTAVQIIEADESSEGGGGKPLTPKEQQAWDMRVAAEEYKPGLEDDKEAYDLLCEQGQEVFKKFSTFKKRLGDARRKLGQSKRNSKAGRTGRSVVRRVDI